MTSLSRSLKSKNKTKSLVVLGMGKSFPSQFVEICRCCMPLLKKSEQCQTLTVHIATHVLIYMALCSYIMQGDLIENPEKTVITNGNIKLNHTKLIDG